MSKSKKTVISLLVIAILIALVPLFMLKGAEFGGSDDAGSKVVAEITGKNYHPWVVPVMNKLIGGKLPSEVESLLFCVQTGIGVGVVSFILGRFVERSKWEKETGKKFAQYDERKVFYEGD